MTVAKAARIQELVHAGIKKQNDIHNSHDSIDPVRQNDLSQTFPLLLDVSLKALILQDKEPLFLK